MKNKVIRQQIAAAGIPYWRLAEKIGISPGTLSVWLRHELSGDRLARVERALKFLDGGEDRG